MAAVDADAALVGTGSISPSARIDAAVAASLLGVGDVVSNISGTFTGQTAFTGTGTLTPPTLSVDKQAEADLLGSGDLTAIGTFLFKAALEGSSSLSVAAGVTYAAGAGLEGVGNIEGSPFMSYVGESDLEGVATITPASSLTATAASNLGGGAALTAAALDDDEAAADLSGSGNISPTATGTFVGEAALQGGGNITPLALVRKPASPAKPRRVAAKVDPLLRAKPPREVITSSAILPRNRRR